MALLIFGMSVKVLTRRMETLLNSMLSKVSDSDLMFLKNILNLREVELTITSSEKVKWRKQKELCSVKLGKALYLGMLRKKLWKCRDSGQKTWRVTVQPLE
jgi:hypothetical protein